MRPSSFSCLYSAVEYSPSHRMRRYFSGSVSPSVENISTWLYAESVIK